MLTLFALVGASSDIFVSASTFWQHAEFWRDAFRRRTVRMDLRIPQWAYGFLKDDLQRMWPLLQREAEYAEASEEGFLHEGDVGGAAPPVAG